MSLDSSKKTLYIDIDSTIWPAEEEYDRAAMELYGIPFGKDWYDVEELIEKFGPDYKQVFRHALDPERILTRKLYPGVATALYELYVESNFTLHFISHNDHDLEAGLEQWLTNILNIPFDITVYPVEIMDKVKWMMYDPNAFALIEDKPAALLDSAVTGYITLAKRQPWNRLTLQENPDIIGFDNWIYVPYMLGVHAWAV